VRAAGGFELDALGEKLGSLCLKLGSLGLELCTLGLELGALFVTPFFMRLGCFASGVLRP
jgi:hypothetical protein